MAKGDHSRAQNKIDEQQTQSQSYLTGIQGNLGNQYGRNDALYWGQGAPTYGTINNMGSTVPNYSPTGGAGLYPGNQSGSQVPNSPQMNGLSGSSYNPQQIGQMALQHAQSLGGATDANLAATVQWMQSQGIPVEANPGSDGFWLNTPNGRVGADMIQGYKSGQGSWQNPLWDSPGLGGGYGAGMGGIPGMTLGDYGQISSLYGSMLPMYQNLYGDLRGPVSYTHLRAHET